MHGLINRSLQCFLRDTYGQGLWLDVAQEARLGFDSFEAMLRYDPALTEAVLTAAAKLLNRPRETVLEDLGTYLVSHPNVEALRRLLRFGGGSFVEFVHSLEELPERGRLALPDLDLPLLELEELGAGQFRLLVRGEVPGTGHAVVGLLRAMADDYGALAVLDHAGQAEGAEVVSIILADQRHSSGRSFDLALAGAAGWMAP